MTASAAAGRARGERVRVGSVTPVEAVAEAARILEEQFNLLCRFPEGIEPEVEEVEVVTQRLELNENLFRTVDELELSGSVPGGAWCP